MPRIRGRHDIACVYLIYHLAMPAKTTATSKHADVRAALLRQVRSGRLRPGERIPTEAELGKLFGVSRITVTRAVRDLQAAGVVERRRGAGTFVRPQQSGAQ